MQIDPYCQQRKCSPVNVVSSDIRVMQIFAGVREIWGIKQENGRLTQCCRAFTLALARLSCTALWTLSRTTRVSWYQKVHFAIFWVFWCKIKITQAETPTIRMDCHPIQTIWCPHLCHPHNFYARCPPWHNPPSLSWLGTGTKYAGLHTRWLGGHNDNEHL